MSPVVGIAPCSSLADYLEAIRRSGGEPRVFDLAGMSPADALKGVDALVFTGGEDVDPRLYGEARHPSVRDAEPGRDEYEIGLAREAIARDLPLLAICRGVQILNVAAGGTLIQDIPSEIEGAVTHHIPTPKAAHAHEIWVSPASLLSRLLVDRLGEGDVCEVNSRHHQSVNKVAPGFIATATAPDGVVEAIERDASRFCLGVQWHPENFWRTGEFRRLFEGLLDATNR